MKIFFDFDGTLIDSSIRHHKVYSDVVSALGGRPIPKNTYWDLKRNKSKWSEILPKSGLNADRESFFLEEFILKIESIEYLKLDTLFEGAVDQVDRLSSDNECYLVSLRRNHENLKAQIDWLGLTTHFSNVLSGHSETDGSDVKSKIIRAEIKGDKQGAIVGDTEADILTGKSIGLKTVAVLSGIRNQAFLSNLQPDYLLNDISEIQVVL